MRKLKYYIATTLDGFIAHEDGSFDGFVWDDEFVADFINSYSWFDVVLMGRKTYEVGLKEGKTSPYPTMQQYVFSRSMKESPDESVNLVSENVVEIVKDLKSQNGKDIWLCGGANLASQLLSEKLIDEVIIKLNPVIFGSGKPLFESSVPQTKLILQATKEYASGIMLIYYNVLIE
ncbi:dihydrofolate reductase family protein [Aerosakkonemataceae cyanobacterium BLCC-F154]|uniref:Dihydrofolate reductase family protein n=1 Tax=Floridaenema fluviatile BLCC-F154 TaxID=3153640 RepID=A0ABV4Y721_9CYAN